MRYCVFGWKSTRGQFHHIMSMVHSFNMLDHHRYWPWSSDRGPVCLVSPLWCYSFSTVLFRRKLLSTTHSYRVGSYTPSPLRWTSCIIYLEFFSIENLYLLPNYSIICLHDVYMICVYTLGYSLIPLYFFCYSDDSSFSHYELFYLCLCDIPPLFCYLFSMLPYFLSLQEASGSLCIFTFPVLKMKESY